MQAVVINGRFLGRRPTGVDRYALEVIRALDVLIGQGDAAVRGLSFEILAPEGTPAPQGLQHVKFRCAGKSTGYVWEQFTLPGQLRGRWLLNLCNTAPLIVRSQSVVIHDAATARLRDVFSPVFRRAYGFMMPAIGRRASAILTISKFSRNELQQCWGIATDQMALAGGSGEHILRVVPDPTTLERLNLRPQAYVLAVGSVAAHKNFARLAEAAKVLEGTGVELAVVGAALPEVFGGEDIAQSPAVRRIGSVNDGELRALYDHALAFAFPSVYEGFGLPPLEAMQCGCPVIASNAASIPEVCAEAAWYFDPFEQRSIQDALLRIVANRDHRTALIAAGRLRSSRFRWSDSARAIATSIHRRSCDADLAPAWQAPE